MRPTTQDSHEQDLLLATSNEPLLEAEAEAFAQEDPNAPPPLEGKWKSLKYRRTVAARLVVCVCIMVAPLIGMDPITRDIMYDVVCDSIGVATDQCAQSDTANEAVARFYAWDTVLSSVLMLALIPLVTGISERFGYRAGMIWSGAWFSVKVLAMYVLVVMVPGHWTYWRMLLLTTLDAIAGGFITVQNTSLLALFQLFPEPQLRPRYTSLAQGIIGATSTLAPSLFAYFGRKYGTDKFILAGAFCFAGSVAFALVMGDMPIFAYTRKAPEADVESKKSSWGKIGDYISTQIAGLSVLSFRHVADHATRMTAFVLLFNRVSTNELAQGGANALLMFAKQNFGWDNKQFGLVSTIIIGTIMFWGLFGFPFLQRWLLKFYKVNPLGVDQLDFRFLLWSTIVRLFGFLGITAARTSSQLIAAVAFKAQSGLSGPTFMTALMKLIPSSEGASLITAASLLDTACGVVVPGLMMQIYKVTLSSWPRLIFQLEAFISLLQLTSIVFFVKVVTGQKPASP